MNVFQFAIFAFSLLSSSAALAERQISYAHLPSGYNASHTAEVLCSSSSLSYSSVTEVSGSFYVTHAQATLNGTIPIGLHRLCLRASNVSGGVVLSSSYSLSPEFNVDTIAPYISNIDSASVNKAYRRGESISLSATFNEPVTPSGSTSGMSLSLTTFPPRTAT